MPDTIENFSADFFYLPFFGVELTVQLTSILNIAVKIILCWYRYYLLHTSRDSVSPACMIFVLMKMLKSTKNILYNSSSSLGRAGLRGPFCPNKGVLLNKEHLKWPLFKRYAILASTESLSFTKNIYLNLNRTFFLMSVNFSRYQSLSGIN